MPMHLYAVGEPVIASDGDAPRLFSARVVREHRDSFAIDVACDHATSAAFRHRRRIPKVEAMVSPESAWSVFLAAQRAAADRLTRELQRCRLNIAAAEDGIRGGAVAL